MYICRPPLPASHVRRPFCWLRRLESSGTIPRWGAGYHNPVTCVQPITHPHGLAVILAIAIAAV